MIPADLNFAEQPQIAYIYPYALQGGVLVAYNPGTRALANTDWSEIHYWRCRATQDGNVYIGCDTYPEVLHWSTELGIRWMRFTFDQNMNPVILFKPLLGNSLIVRYFNPAFQEFQLKTLPTNTTSAAILLDDIENTEISNIFIFYTLNNKLYVYTQSDLYTTPTEVYGNVQGQIILAVGMTDVRRLQLVFGFSPLEGGMPEVPERIPRGASNHVEFAKYVGEKLPIRISMLDRCIDGESIDNVVVTATVSSGVDANPTAIISGTATVTNGDLVDQLVVAGLPGVIYTLWFTARSTLNNLYIDFVTLAVMPSEVPVWADFRITDADDVRVTDSGDRRIVDMA